MKPTIVLGLVVAIGYGLFTGVFLPTYDVINDLWLMVNTYNFVGDGLEMAGCRACYEKTEAELLESSLARNKNCKICVSDRAGFGHSGHYCAGFSDSLDKITKLQASDECERSEWRIGFVTKPKFRATYGAGSCRKGDYCCIRVGKELNVSRGFTPGKNVDPRNAWVFCRNKINCPSCNAFGTCESCLGIGSSTAPECDKYFSNYDTSRNLLRNGGCSAQSYRLSKISERGTRQFVEGECRFEDECCLNVKETMKPANYMRCNQNICLMHINWIQTDSNIIKNFSSWGNNKEIIHGRVVGGKICSTLRFYALCLIFPLILNFTFTFITWYSDYKREDTHLASLVFTTFQFYPQWRTIRYLYSEKEQANAYGDMYRLRLDTLEAILESVFQVTPEPISYARL